MLKGIEVLSQAEVVAEAIFNWKAFWIAFAVVGVIGIIISIIALHDVGWDAVAIFAAVIVVVAGGLTGAMMGAVFEIPKTYETQYKVIISDEVQMNEFFEEYEIVDQDGKIYIIREKTENG